MYHAKAEKSRGRGAATAPCAEQLVVNRSNRGLTQIEAGSPAWRRWKRFCVFTGAACKRRAPTGRVPTTARSESALNAVLSRSVNGKGRPSRFGSWAPLLPLSAGVVSPMTEIHAKGSPRHTLRKTTSHCPTANHAERQFTANAGRVFPLEINISAPSKIWAIAANARIKRWKAFVILLTSASSCQDLKCGNYKPVI